MGFGVGTIKMTAIICSTIAFYIANKRYLGRFSSHN